jgi:hypothetical protein
MIRRIGLGPKHLAALGFLFLLSASTIRYFNFHTAPAYAIYGCLMVAAAGLLLVSIWLDHGDSNAAR